MFEQIFSISSKSTSVQCYMPSALFEEMKELLAPSRMYLDEAFGGLEDYIEDLFT